MSAIDHQYHPGKPEDTEKFEAIRNKIIETEALFDQVCPPGRDLSLAKTNLEQARMWAIGAIVKPRPKPSH